jgi:hypothetical protein
MMMLVMLVNLYTRYNIKAYSVSAHLKQEVGNKMALLGCRGQNNDKGEWWRWLENQPSAQPHPNFPRCSLPATNETDCSLIYLAPLKLCLGQLAHLRFDGGQTV